MMSPNDVIFKMAVDCNHNTEHDRYYDVDMHHVIKRNCIGHMTRSRLLTGLLASACLTLCSLLTHCVSVTSSREDGCHGEVKVIGRLVRQRVVVDETGDVQRTIRRHQLVVEEPIQRLPQCLIIGVRKGGTRALLEFLSLHPDVRIQKQELHFFDDAQTYSLGLDWYRRQMPYTTSTQLTVEKTPGYFIGDDVPDRVRAMNKSIKLLVIVRDPVERAISDYAQLHAARLRRGKYHARFEDLAIDPLTGAVEKSYRALRRSMYCLDMVRWLDAFELRQFHFVNGERLVTSPVDELRKVETFLGLGHLINDSMFYFNDSRGFYCMKAPPITPMGGAIEEPTNVHQSLKETSTSLKSHVQSSRAADGTMAEQVADGGIVYSDRCLASSKGRVHPNISGRVIHKLRKFFRPCNELFYKQTAVNFSWPVR